MHHEKFSVLAIALPGTMTEPIRLSRHVAEMVPCSRREAELFIEGGWVSVDGKVVEEPHFRVSTQVVVLHADAKLDPPEPVTILLHQPVSEKSAALANINRDNHASDDVSGIELRKRHFSKLSPTLPLQENASGLVVFTQDWRVARKLVDNAATVEQEYVVDVTGELSPAAIKQLNRRIGSSESGKSSPSSQPPKVSMQSEQRLRVAIKGVQRREIAAMCTSAGLVVASMKRIRIGRVAMAKLPPGQWRYLPVAEWF